MRSDIERIERKVDAILKHLQLRVDVDAGAITPNEARENETRKLFPRLAITFTCGCRDTVPYEILDTTNFESKHKVLLGEMQPLVPCNGKDCKYSYREARHTVAYAVGNHVQVLCDRNVKMPPGTNINANGTKWEPEFELVLDKPLITVLSKYILSIRCVCGFKDSVGSIEGHSKAAIIALGNHNRAHPGCGRLLLALVDGKFIEPKDRPLFMYADVEIKPLTSDHILQGYGVPNDIIQPEICQMPVFEVRFICGCCFTRTKAMQDFVASKKCNIMEGRCVLEMDQLVEAWNYADKLGNDTMIDTRVGSAKWQASWR